MTLKTLAAAAAISALMSGAALAQQPMPHKNMPGHTTSTTTDSSVSTDTTTGAVTTDTTTGAVTTDTTTTSDGTTTATSATSYASGASVTTSMTTNGPVPDTAENRTKYGMPMSNAGKRTAARGN